jgi:FecR protein
VGRAQAETPPTMYPQIVRLSYVEGDVRLTRGPAGEKATGDEWAKAEVDVPIYSGFTLVTGAGGRAEIEFEDASHVYLDENSVLSFTDLSANATSRHTEMALVSGVMTIDAESPMPGNTIMVHTPQNGFWLKSPAKAFLRVNSYLDAMELTPMVDHTKVNTPTGLTDSHAGQKLVFTAGQKIPTMAPVGTNDFAAWDAWVRERSAAHTEAMNAAMQNAGLNSPVPGLTEIAAQGSFFDCAPYGKCWAPKDGWDPGGAGDGAGESAPQTAPSLQAAAVRPQTSGAAAQMGTAPCNLPDPSQCVVEDNFFPCSPLVLRNFYERDPVSGQLVLVFSENEIGPYGYGRSYLWGVCHTGSWIRWHKRYAWVAGTHRHHRWGVRWVKVGNKTGFVPVHPRDVTGKPPLNIKHGVYLDAGKKDHGTVLVKVNEPVKLLDNTPKEYAKLTYPALPKTEAPHMEARALHETADHKGDGAAKPALITLDHKSQVFQVAHTVMQGGHEHQITEPVGGRMNTGSNNSGMSIAFHGGPQQSSGWNSGAGSRSFSAPSEGAHASAPSYSAPSAPSAPVSAPSAPSGGAHH